MIVREHIERPRLGQRPLWSPVRQPEEALELAWLKIKGAHSVEECDVSGIWYVITRSGILLAKVFKASTFVKEGGR